MVARNVFLLLLNNSRQLLLNKMYIPFLPSLYVTVPLKWAIEKDEEGEKVHPPSGHSEGGGEVST